MISNKEALEVLRSADLEDGDSTKIIKLAVAPKAVRLGLISESPESDEARHSAAIEIQRQYRGYCTRCRLLTILHGDTSKTAIYGDSNHALDRLQETMSPDRDQGDKTVARQKLEDNYSNYVNRLIASGIDPTSAEIPSFNDFCANNIQRWWQSGKHRDKAGPSLTKIPVPPIRPARKTGDQSISESDAAAIIQKAWRRHIDVQVYRYYRDLINFKSRGDPAMMLRCINPKEATFLDAAAGIHIKFRLAGARFPPNIYYKVFTHRPIQDLCANSPKDYTKHDCKKLLSKDIHNKGNRVPKKSTEGWYQRTENNGWRLVSDRLISHILSDPVTWDTSRKKMDFHHNKLQRKADVEKKKKLKKIDWMKQMYHKGMLKAKVDDGETVGLIEGAAAGMVATIERHGTHAVQDWEVDELLEWTTSLNFDDYWDNWKEIATSANSENPMHDRLKLTSGGPDPYEIALSRGDPGGSTQQSHNTPVSSHAGSVA